MENLFGKFMNREINTKVNKHKSKLKQISVHVTFYTCINTYIYFVNNFWHLMIHKLIESFIYF